jgi:signal transduction histidine kinase
MMSVPVSVASRMMGRSVGGRDPRASRLAVSLVLIGLTIASMVVVPFALYLHGKAIRNHLTLEVGAMELAIERASRAMASRERAFRAYLYSRAPAHLLEFEQAGNALDVALENAAALARSSERDEWRAAVEQLRAIATEWETSADPLMRRAERGDATTDEALAAEDRPRPGSIYDRFQQVSAGELHALHGDKTELTEQLATADQLRLVMPFLLLLLGTPVMFYVARLSSQVLRLLDAARAEEQRLGAILEHMFDPVLVTDRSGTVTLANPAARRILGLESGVPVSSLASRLAEADSEGAIAPGAMLSGISGAVSLGPADAHVDGADGERRPVSVSTAPIVIAGRVTGAVTVFRDLSDRARYEEERVKSERFSALGSMAERLAHDFGNYLEAASGATAMLERPSAADPANRAKWAGLIRTTIDEGRNVLSGLRTLSFISHRAPRFYEVDLGALVGRAVDVARLARSEAQGIRFELTLPAGVPVAASEADLLRAIVNVIVNAIDAMPEGGALRVAIERTAGDARVVINDAGTGIPPEDHEKIFDMYYTTKAERGSGMGLTLAREVLRLHGGDIEVASESGRGSTFTLTIPTAITERTQAPGPRPGGSAAAMEVTQ